PGPACRTRGTPASARVAPDAGRVVSRLVPVRDVPGARLEHQPRPARPARADLGVKPPVVLERVLGVVAWERFAVGGAIPVLVDLDGDRVLLAVAVVREPVVDADLVSVVDAEAEPEAGAVGGDHRAIQTWSHRLRVAD